MKVQIEKNYPMPCAADVAWTFLQDLQAVAGCMPGAKITERLDDGRYKGTVTVKLGPATMAFRGEVEMKGVDPAARSLQLIGKGTDSTGSSGATLNLTARVEPGADAAQCHLIGSSEVSMSGKAVAFGGRMMNAVADQLLKQFADNFANRVGEIEAQRGAGIDRTPPGGASAAAAGSTGAAAASAPTAPVAQELNGLALMWAVFKDWLRSLFGKKPA
jgi:carbon monoxide dehydrogenase subunit G